MIAGEDRIASRNLAVKGVSRTWLVVRKDKRSATSIFAPPGLR
jgi:hypothetical protein